MPARAFNIFTLDVHRAEELISHADTLPDATPSEQLLRSDVLRCGWMFAVGAMDSYFCDSYTDVVAAAMISKQRHPAAILPDFIDDIRVPVGAVLAQYGARPNWRWRMAARGLMEKENVLDLSRVQTLFNKFFRTHHHLWGDVLDAWMRAARAGDRVFGITSQAYAAMTQQQRETQRKSSRQHFERRFKSIIQRRHDCIHTCDRPRSVPQVLKRPGTVRNVIRDISFLINLFEIHANAEINHFLHACRVPNPIIGQFGY